MDAFRVDDRVIGGVVGLLAVGYLAMAWRIPEFALATVPVQSRAFPLGLGALLLVLAITLVVRPGGARPEVVGDAASAEAEAPPSQEASAPGVQLQHRSLRRFTDARLEIAVLVVTASAYIAAFELLGFVLATVVYLVAMSWYFGFTRWVVSVVVALAVTGGLYVLLVQLLNVRLPTSPLLGI